MFHYCSFVERLLLFAAYLGSPTRKAEALAATQLDISQHSMRLTPCVLGNAAQCCIVLWNAEFCREMMLASCTTA